MPKPAHEPGTHRQRGFLPGPTGSAPHHLSVEAYETLLGQATESDDLPLAGIRLRLQLLPFHARHLQDRDRIRLEVDRVLHRIRSDQNDYMSWHRPPHSFLDSGLRSLKPHLVSPATADIVHRRFHYIGTSRVGMSVGLSSDADDEAPGLATLLTFSPFDPPHLEELLPAHIDPSEALVLSRAYSFSWAPRNAFSYLFRRALQDISRRYTHLRYLVTYVNPNLGFTGSSLRAANWRLIGSAPRTVFSYVDGIYTTQRELLRMLGTADLSLLPDILGARFTVASTRPLMVFGYDLRSHS